MPNTSALRSSYSGGNAANSLVRYRSHKIRAFLRTHLPAPFPEPTSRPAALPESSSAATAGSALEASQSFAAPRSRRNAHSAAQFLARIAPDTCCPSQCRSGRPRQDNDPRAEQTIPEISFGRRAHAPRRAAGRACSSSEAVVCVACTRHHVDRPSSRSSQYSPSAALPEKFRHASTSAGCSDDVNVNRRRGYGGRSVALTSRWSAGPPPAGCAMQRPAVSPAVDAALRSSPKVLQHCPVACGRTAPEPGRRGVSIRNR